MHRIVPLAAVPPARVEQLLDAAFGADRRTRTAYRLRAGVDALPLLSLAALDGQGELAGSLQCWPIALQETNGKATPLALVGPVAVWPALQRAGIGRDLMSAALDVADRHQVLPLVLIGDPEYYGRFFGFSDAATGGWEVPGPVERRRLLARTGGRALPATGMLGPRS